MLRVRLAREGHDVTGKTGRKRRRSNRGVKKRGEKGPRIQQGGGCHCIVIRKIT